MTLQFIWQGCDSLLAAPLVLDLIRFTAPAGVTSNYWHLAPYLSSLISHLSSFIPASSDR